MLVTTLNIEQDAIVLMIPMSLDFFLHYKCTKHQFINWNNNTAYNICFTHSILNQCLSKCLHIQSENHLQPINRNLTDLNCKFSCTNSLRTICRFEYTLSFSYKLDIFIVKDILDLYLSSGNINVSILCLLTV